VEFVEAGYEFMKVATEINSMEENSYRGQLLICRTGKKVPIWTRSRNEGMDSCYVHHSETNLHNYGCSA
jgi:hypothetical protein